jgi:hypothetical protein
MALQMIGYLEQQQTQLEAELKALPPQEKKAAQGAVDALMPRLAALPRSDPPPAQPVPVAKSSPLPAARIRSTAAASALPVNTVPLNPLALPQMVQQQFTLVQQALMQTH